MSDAKCRRHPLGDVEPLHQYPLGLADDIAGRQGLVQILCQILQCAGEASMRGRPPRAAPTSSRHRSLWAAYTPTSKMVPPRRAASMAVVNAANRSTPALRISGAARALGVRLTP